MLISYDVIRQHNIHLAYTELIAKKLTTGYGFIGRIKKNIFRPNQFLLYILLGINNSNAYAYNETGHYYTLLALFNTNLVSATPEERLRAIRLETFCAELPDLAKELDAVTQRARVFKSTNDFEWAIMGNCQSHVSKHMVASQYYLHGLSGTPAPQLRKAAEQTIDAIDNELKESNLTSEHHRNLICARGFAAHLFGDSFAHIKLKTEHAGFFSISKNTEMYDTGMGHARDGHTPDYVYAHIIDRIDQWTKWVDAANIKLIKGIETKPVLDAHKGCIDKSFEKCEDDDKKQMKKLVHDVNINLPVDMQYLLDNGNSGISDMERAWTCEEVIKKAFPDTPNDRPDCAATWKLYLKIAAPIFFKQGIDPTARSNATADLACSAWRCEGKPNYNKESAEYCSVDIVDDLKYGRNQ